MNQEPLQDKTVDYIFMHFHGRFGNTFFNKYRIGKANDDGDDLGVLNAKKVWAQRLGGMSKERLKNALDHTYDGTPSLDDFVLNCRVTAEYQDHKALTKKLTDEEMEIAHENVQKIQAELKKKKSFDWVAYWTNIKNNPKGFPHITVRFAEQALANLRQA